VAGDIAHDVTFSGMRGVFFTITSKGELVMGQALHDDHASNELAEMLVDLFGRAYGSALLKAESRALATETLNKSLERRLKDAEDRAKAAENQLKRGTVHVVNHDKPSRLHHRQSPLDKDDDR
jgi:ABC-type phosphate transport system auxiliary subunit